MGSRVLTPKKNSMGTGLNSFFLQVVEFSCLGDWVVGKNQYFAVANTKESRIDEKFRCFMKNRDDDYFLGQSNTPECNHIKTVEQVRFESLYFIP